MIDIILSKQDVNPTIKLQSSYMSSYQIDSRYTEWSTNLSIFTFVLDVVFAVLLIMLYLQFSFHKAPFRKSQSSKYDL